MTGLFAATKPTCVGIFKDNYVMEFKWKEMELSEEEINKGFNLMAECGSAPKVWKVTNSYLERMSWEDPNRYKRIKIKYPTESMEKRLENGAYTNRRGHLLNALEVKK
jgi:hypothetical protein